MIVVSYTKVTNCANPYLVFILQSLEKKHFLLRLGF